MRVIYLVMLLAVSFSVYGQRANPDAIARRNASLEILLLEYKEQLHKANKNIKRLFAENARLKHGISDLMQKQNKDEDDISRLMTDRNRLLSNKTEIEQTLKQREITVKLLEEANKQLKADNAVLKSNNVILEEAAMMADTIQRYQDQTIQKQKKSIKELSENYAQKCSEITGQYKIPLSRNTLNVVLDGSERGPDNKHIESLTVSACFQLIERNANDKLIVYFTLFEKEKKNAVRRVRFAIPKTKETDNGSYYEGSHIIKTDDRLRLSDDVKYYYEITYKESVISHGIINPS